MNVFLKQISPEHEVFRSRIEAGQRFTIGGSELSNRRITSEWPLPEVCAILEVTDDACILMNAAPGRIPMNVNGQPAHQSTLRNGDTIQIGPAAFAVTWKEVSPSVQSETPPVIVRSYVQQSTRSGLRQFGPGPNSWSLSATVEQLSRKLSPILFVNAKAANIRFRDALKTLPDLYEHASDEIRESNSLHAIMNYPVGDLWKVYQAFHRHDAAVWAFVDGDPNATLKEAMLYLGWFARPSSLRLHLEQGSKALLDGLMKPFSAVALHSETSNDWAVYAKPRTMWNEIGFEKPPA